MRRYGQYPDHHDDYSLEEYQKEIQQCAAEREFQYDAMREEMNKSEKTKKGKKQ